MLRGTDSLLYRVNLMSCENAPARGLLFWGSLIGFLTSGAVCIFMFTGNDYFRSLILDKFTWGSLSLHLYLH
jgi:hypothetical protein